MKPLRILGVVFALAALLGAAPPHTTLFAFSPEASNAERQFEGRFMDLPSAAGMYANAQRIAKEAHPPASEADHELASFVCDTIRSYGVACKLEPYVARADVPRRIALQLIAPPPSPTPMPSPAARGRARPPGPLTLDLREPAIEGDPATARAEIPLPFVQGSGNGDVRAPLVYAGRGLETDYQQLAGHGVNVAGAVVLVRFGGQTPAQLVARAQAAGAAGVLLYPDPADDGAGRGPTYPDGPWRPATSVRRAYAGENVRVPALSISAANAQLLLGAIAGPAGGAGWSGGLPIAYPYGRGPGIAHLTVQLKSTNRTHWNTVATIIGTRPETSVLVAGSRDAAVFGANVNGGATATVLEVARGLGYLAKNGWTPGRSIVLCTWDGSVAGGTGARTYAARHGDMLRSTIAYLDADRPVLGPRFAADAAAGLGSGIVDTVREVSSPTDIRISVFDDWVRAERTPLPPIAVPPGAGSTEPFFFALGIPTAHLAFTGPFGVTDSAYDTLRFTDRYGDPNFTLHQAAAQAYGILAMRLADATVVPYRFASYAALMRASAAQLADRAKAMNVAGNLAPLEPAIATFATAADAFDLATARAANAARSARAIDAARTIDLGLYSASGYDGQTFAALSRAVDGGDAAAVDRAVADVRALLERAAALLSS